MPTLLDRGAHGLSRHLTFVLFITASIATSSCGDSKSPTEPAAPTSASAAGTSSSVAVSALQSSVTAQPVRNARCPNVAPFDIPFVIVVNPFFTPGVVVTQIQVQFTDMTGITMPQVTFPAPLPIQEFGSTLGTPRGDMRFPLTLNVGCSIGHNGNMAVTVETRDGHGRRNSKRVDINVR